MQTLDQLPRGQLASIVEIAGDDAVAARLMEMGLHAGEAVEVIGRAPFRDPITVLCRGSRLALRAADARRISVCQLEGDLVPS
jgi:ferrous iron transport protein A